MKHTRLSLRNALVIIPLCVLTLNVVGQWKFCSPPTTASFRSLWVSNKLSVWAGGSGGTIMNTTDGGQTFRVFQLGDAYDFRGIYAPDDGHTVVAMSAGLAEEGAAKIFKTTDGGETWTAVFVSAETGVFLDCLRFIDPKTGYVLGDPVAGKPFVLKTTDGGETWQRLPPDRFPPVLPDEASFAASNSNIAFAGKRVLFSTQSRVFYSDDAGETWNVTETPFAAGKTAGIFGLYFWDENAGVAVGGDYINDKAEYPNVARTADGGGTWSFAETAPPLGLKESAYRLKKKTLLAVGTSGTSRSADRGIHWSAVDEQSFHVINCYRKSCYAVGGKGQMAVWK